MDTFLIGVVFIFSMNELHEITQGCNIISEAIMLTSVGTLQHSTDDEMGQISTLQNSTRVPRIKSKIVSNMKTGKPYSTS